MFKWEVKTHQAQNAIYIEKEVEGKGRFFRARFLQAGLVNYSFGVCLLNQESIMKFAHSFVGCPVVIDHKDVTEESAKDDRVGVISKVDFDNYDGWFWCEGIIFDDKAIELVNNGYNVSCQYEITEYAKNIDGKLHNGNKYDIEILNGRPEHLAIVENPRYENAMIAVNAICANDEYNRDEKGKFTEKNTDKTFEEVYEEVTKDKKEKTPSKIDYELESRKTDPAKVAFERNQDKDDEEENINKTKAITEYEKSKNNKDVDTLKGANEMETTNGILEKIFNLLAKNEADKKEDKEAENKCKNEDTDKRKLIDEVGGILKGKVDEEVWRTIIGKIEKVAYSKSEAGTADNKAKNEDDEEKKCDKEVENKAKNEDSEKEEKFKEMKEEIKKDIENEKAKNSLDEARRKIYGGKVEKVSTHITQKQALELGKKLY